MRKIVITITLIAICLSLAACGHESPYEAVSEGEEMRDFTSKTVDGADFTLSDNKGKVIMLNFWATWCGPCVEEMPAFPRLVEKYGDDLVIVTVNIGEDAKTVGNFLDENGYTTFTVLLDEDYAISDLYPSEGIPYTVIIDREGTISAIKLGADNADIMFEEYSGLIDSVL